MIPPIQRAPVAANRTPAPFPPALSQLRSLSFGLGSPSPATKPQKNPSVPVARATVKSVGPRTCEIKVVSPFKEVHDRFNYLILEYPQANAPKLLIPLSSSTSMQETHLLSTRFHQFVSYLS